MGNITAIKSGKGRSRRTRVYLDGKLLFDLDNEVVSRNKLQVGQNLPDEQIKALAGLDQSRRCYNAAVRLLGYRPRSESEIRVRLQRRGFERDTIESAVTRLRQQGLINDAAFAAFWKENRDTFKPRSRGLLKLELKQKGVDSETINEVVNSADDAESAYRAAISKARRIPRTDYESFRYRLGGYLKRRGFSYRVIDHAVKQAWEEKSNSPDNN